MSQRGGRATSLDAGEVVVSSKGLLLFATAK
jgi:hypothetical protein